VGDRREAGQGFGFRVARVLPARRSEPSTRYSPALYAITARRQSPANMPCRS
jgi:hypothetical protein